MHEEWKGARQPTSAYAPELWSFCQCLYRCHDSPGSFFGAQSRCYTSTDMCNRLLSYLFSLCRWVLQMMFLLRTLVDAPGFSFTHSLHNIPKVPRPGKRRTPKIWSASWRACIRALTAHVTSQILFPVTRQMFQTASLSRNGYARPITKWICA